MKEHLRVRIEELAAKRGVSMNTLIVDLLDRGLAGGDIDEPVVWVCDDPDIEFKIQTDFGT